MKIVFPFSILTTQSGREGRGRAATKEADRSIQDGLAPPRNAKTPWSEEFRYIITEVLCYLGVSDPRGKWIGP